MEKLTKSQIAHFQNFVYEFYTKNKRHFNWRTNITPYKIVVSEIMLQQTQTARVIPKFETWLARFPDFQTLAQASNFDVLAAWQGLGYNRRGLALATIAQKVVHEYQAILPQNPEILQTLPAIGPNTAGSICAFAFNLPTIFIETNIRTVFTHTFFKDQAKICDKILLPLIAQTIDQKEPREWYYALMDYGVHLKQKLPGINAKSKQYARQSKFEGSKRQIRGLVIKILTEVQHINEDEILELIAMKLPNNAHDPQNVLDDLASENIIKINNNVISL